MLVEAFQESKELIDWITLDHRVHCELTFSAVAKRIKRGWVPELALTTPIVKGARKGDTKQRVKAREDKLRHMAKMFRLAQLVREKHEKGVEVLELQNRYALSKSQVEKIVSKNEHYNIHWRNRNIPEQFKEYVVNDID